MVVVDTSAWIEWLSGSTLGKDFSPFLDHLSECIVPTIVQLELAKWTGRELPSDEADRVLAYTRQCHIVPLDSDLAFAAAEMCQTHKLATADAIVYATALQCGAELLTCDAHFDGLEHVRYFAKGKSI